VQVGDTKQKINWHVSWRPRRGQHSKMPRGILPKTKVQVRMWTLNREGLNAKAR